jgi:hypothetical protein
MESRGTRTAKHFGGWKTKSKWANRGNSDFLFSHVAKEVLAGDGIEAAQALAQTSTQLRGLVEQFKVTNDSPGNGHSR